MKSPEKMPSRDQIYRPSRRALLRAATLAAASALLLPFASRIDPSHASPAEEPTPPLPPETRSWRWRSSGSPFNRPDTLEGAPEWITSETYISPDPFNAIGSSYRSPLVGSDGQLLRLLLQASPDGNTWTEWTDVTASETLSGKQDNSAPDALALKQRQHGELMLGEDWRQARYRLVSSEEGATPPTAEEYIAADVELILIDTVTGFESVTPASNAPGSLAPAVTDSVPRPNIISRAGWGCDNSGDRITWDLEYQPIEKCIVHHTAGTNSYSDGAAQVRAVYYYHAVTLDWGDIGYNYLVDKYGNIYEGRKGGESVVGGHALQFNYGSVGVSILGNHDTVGVSEAGMSAFASIIAWSCRNLDPNGWSNFHNVWCSNISGHRDVMSTSCPGQYLYSRLPELRGRVKTIIDANYPAPTPTPIPYIRPEVRIDGITIAPETVISGTLLKVALSLTNTGTVTLPTEGPGPGFVYNEGESFQSRGFGEVRGAFRIAIDYDGHPSGPDHPYRWGLASPLSPGQSTTVEGYVRLQTSSTRLYWVGLVEEAIAWRSDGLCTTNVQVMSAACTRVLPPPTGVPPNLNRKILLPMISTDSTVCGTNN